jgi:hypothetical protein
MLVLLFATCLGLIAWLAYRLLRWARSSGRGTQAIGAVLSEVTQGPAVREAKQGNERKDLGAGDPANDE